MWLPLLPRISPKIRIVEIKHKMHAVFLDLFGHPDSMLQITVSFRVFNLTWIIPYAKANGINVIFL